MAISTEPLLALSVPGTPVPKARPRLARAHGRHYTPRPTVQAEDKIRVAARNAWMGRHTRPVKDPVALEVVFWLPNKRRVDLDNLVKLVTDAMNGEIYADDSQIWSLEARKAFSAVDPRTEITIHRLSGGHVEVEGVTPTAH